MKRHDWNLVLTIVLFGLMFFFDTMVILDQGERIDDHNKLNNTQSDKIKGQSDTIELLSERIETLEAGLEEQQKMLWDIYDMCKLEPIPLEEGPMIRLLFPAEKDDSSSWIY